MNRFAVDSNVLIAAAQPTDPRYAAASTTLERRLVAGDVMIIPAPALLELYSVLTRLPPPFRARPSAAAASATSFAEAGEVVALPADAYLRLLDRAAREGITGGAIYDAAIATVAEAAGVDVILTFNVRDFTRITSLPIIAPSET